tara:strand:+ start:4516 stop:5649 length:1134 start_codon:yes stop_codon:yes gene_type:complete
MYTTKRGFSSLFEEEDADDNEEPVSVNDRMTLRRAREEDQEKRRRESYVLHIGPKFRKGHHTPFRSTNVQVIKAESAAQATGGTGAPSNSLFDFVVDDVRAGTVRAYTGLDIVLGSMIHPESPKLIKMELSQLDMDGTLDVTTAGIEVPLYLNLTKNQFQDVLYQLGLPNRDEDISLVRMNVQGIAGYKIDPTEMFINEFIGRMARHRTNAQVTIIWLYFNFLTYFNFFFLKSTWDSQENFFQTINFKIRIGPQKRNKLSAIDNLSRGMMAPDDCDDSGCTRRCKREKSILCDQEEQFLPYEPEPIVQGKSETKQQKDEREWQEKRRKNQKKQDEQLEEFYDSGPREDGTSHAGVMEHVGFWEMCKNGPKMTFFQIL